MTKRNVDLTSAGISPWGYRELLYFCRQYDEKRSRLQGEVSGAERLRLEMDVRDIEQCAKAVRGCDAGVLIDNVARGISCDLCAAAMGRRQFYAARKRFFTALAERRTRRQEAMVRLLDALAPDHRG